MTAKINPTNNFFYNYINFMKRSVAISIPSIFTRLLAVFAFTWRERTDSESPMHQMVSSPAAVQLVSRPRSSIIQKRWSLNNEDQKPVKLAITIPAYNEEETIGKVIRAIPLEIKRIDEIEIIVINDGSKDRTAEAAMEAGATRIISHLSNRGVGAAFSSGLSTALETGADIIVNIDADGQFDPKDIPKLIEPILNREAEFVTASRFLDKSLEPDMPFIKRVGNGLFVWTINKITAQKFTDTQCGFRAFSRKAALKLNLFGKFTYTQEVFLDLVNKDIVIKEVPIKVIYPKDRRSRVVKNPIIYGLKALAIIIRTVRDSAPLFFFGSVSMVFLLSGFISGLWLFVRWLMTGEVTPYRSFVTVIAVLLITGLILGVLALMADMFTRQRKIQEEILFYNKLQVYGNGDKKFKAKNTQ